jgi:asparagine synthase (glutamine-hydrolysing)
VSQRAITRQFFGQQLDRSSEPGFGHLTRWNGAAALKRLFSPALRTELDGVDAIHALVAGLPGEFREWTPLAQDQYLEIFTLMSGYLLSSQGDRMLMAHSVEGRFPFLDRNVGALAESLPPSYKLRILDEKHVLKRAAKDVVPAAILQRPKQPYRAPDALSFASPAATEWIETVASERSLAEASVFASAPARNLIEKCRSRARDGQFSNADNMAVVGILSTQLVHHHFVARRVEASVPPVIRTLVDRLALAEAG